MKNRWLLPHFFWITSLIASDKCCIDSCECCPIEHSGYFHLKHREPGGIGYPRGYTSLEFFYTMSPCDHFRYSFVDLRAHLDNGGKWATNLGIGTRKIGECSDTILGFNLYWDWRNGKRGSYHKIGVGTEILWPYWDIHFNGYIPIGRMRKTTRIGFDEFQGHRAIMSKKYLLNMGGFDGSIGYWLFKCGCVDMHASLGGYYFRGNFNTDFGGGIAKAKLRFWNWIELKGQVSYDNEFKWVGQGELGIYLSFGPTLKRYSRKTSCCADLIALEQRLLEQPDRFEISVLTSHKKKDVALHPVTEDPLTFYFVDNTSSSNGTIESPFPTIGQAEAVSSSGDAIYVFPGNETGYDETLTLKDNQLFGGSGAPFEVQSRFGLLEIPQLTKTKPAMIGSGVKVTLANQTRITGMSLTSTDTHAIEAAGPIAGTIIIADNSLNAFDEGIQFSDTFVGIANIFDNLIEASGSGIEFTGAFNGTANTFNNLIDADDIGIHFGDTFAGTADVHNNSIVSGNDGIVFSGVFNGTNRIYDNSITAVNDGIKFLSTFSGIVDIYSNTIFNRFNNIKFEDSVSGVANIYNNSMNNDFIGINFVAFSGTTNIYNNAISGRFEGILFRSATTFVGTHNIYNNFITSFGTGVELNTINGSLFFFNNQIYSGERGFRIIDSMTSGTLFMENNSIISRRSVFSNNSAPLLLDNMTVFMRNNAFTQIDFVFDIPVNIESENGINAIIQNNLFKHVISDNVPALLWDNSSGTSHLEFANNSGMTRGDVDIEFSVSGGILEIESTNQSLSGLEAMNEGVIDAPGVTFVPYE